MGDEQREAILRMAQRRAVTGGVVELAPEEAYELLNELEAAEAENAKLREQANPFAAPGRKVVAALQEAADWQQVAHQAEGELEAAKAESARLRMALKVIEHCCGCNACNVIAREALAAAEAAEAKP